MNFKKIKKNIFVSILGSGTIFSMGGIVTNNSAVACFDKQDLKRIERTIVKITKNDIELQEKSLIVHKMLLAWSNAMSKVYSAGLSNEKLISLIDMAYNNICEMDTVNLDKTGIEKADDISKFVNLDSYENFMAYAGMTESIPSTYRERIPSIYTTQTLILMNLFMYLNQKEYDADKHFISSMSDSEIHIAQTLSLEKLSEMLNKLNQLVAEYYSVPLDETPDREVRALCF